MSEIFILIIGMFIGWIVPCPVILQTGINKVTLLIREKLNLYK